MPKDDNAILHYLFNPRTIAIVGASNTDGKMGNLFVRNLISNYSGEIFLIHPTAKEILGIQAYPAITSLPTKIDLLIPLIPAGEVLKLVTLCAVGQVKTLLAIPSGFGEVSEDGKYLEEQLISLARKRKMRVVGPNSLGAINCSIGLNASMVPEIPPRGPGFSCITQSGGFGMAVYMYTHDHQLELTKFCDLGNTADLKIHEFLDYFLQDIDTHIVGIYLESFVDEGSFYTHTKMLANKKPVILTRLGRTHAGRRASFAHLGIQPGNANFQDNLKNCRIIPSQTGLELLDIAKGLNWQPLPKGRKVGILTGSGGVGAELADLCEEQGLDVPEFSPQLQATLRPYLPFYASVRNPVDLTPIWREYPKIYPPLLEKLFASDEIDILIVAIIDVATTLEPLMYGIIETIDQIKNEYFLKKPVYIYWASPHNMREHRQILQRACIPCYHSTITTVRVAAAICQYALQSTTERD